MSVPTLHLPLDRDGERLLIQFADPIQRDLPSATVPHPEQLNLLISAAARHGVLPAVIRRLNELVAKEREKQSSDATVEAAGKVLKEARSIMAFQAGMQMKMAHHARRTVAAFALAGIAGTVVKGAAFAERLYPDASLRTFTDVDVLIAEADRHKVGDVMRPLGFELFEFEDRKGKDYHEQKWLLKPHNDVMIEVHSNLVHSPKLRGAMSVKYEDVLEAGGGDGSEATALLFVAAAHGAIGHQLDRLQHLIDVMQAARGYAGPIDAGRLARVSRKCGVTLAIAGALQLAGKTFDEPCCTELARQLMPSKFARLPSQLLSPALVLRGQSAVRARGSWRRNLFRQALKIG